MHKPHTILWGVYEWSNGEWSNTNDQKSFHEVTNDRIWTCKGSKMFNQLQQKSPRSISIICYFVWQMIKHLQVNFLSFFWPFVIR